MNSEQQGICTESKVRVIRIKNQTGPGLGKLIRNMNKKQDRRHSVFNMILRDGDGGEEGDNVAYVMTKSECKCA